MRMQSLEALFGVSVNRLVDHFRSPLAAPFLAHTGQGQSVHLIARFDWPVWHTLADAAVMAATTGKRVKRATLTAVDSKSGAAPEESRIDGPDASAMRALAAFETGDATMAALVHKARHYLELNSPILLLGETGTGKSMLARALHQSSRRRDKPFIVIHCAALTPSMVDQLLTVDAAAFVNVPRHGQVGKLGDVGGGTLFLDEIGDAPLDVQARLLEVLQSSQGLRAGGLTSALGDMAVISATQRPLRDMVTAQRFREDLYYRLNGLTLKLPALRERSDLKALTAQILGHASGVETQTVHADVHALLQACAWPGNVRQLANVLNAARAMVPTGATLTCEHLPEDFLDDVRLPKTASHPLESNVSILPVSRALPLERAGHAAASLDAIELAAIRAAVDACRGNISLASKHLGVSRNTVYRKLRGQAAPS